MRSNAFVEAAHLYAQQRGRFDGRIAVYCGAAAPQSAAKRLPPHKKCDRLTFYIRRYVVIYFTSDPHLGHKNIISHCQRPFASLEEMDQQLISAWNRRIRTEDTVYILGDLMFFCKDPQWYLERLNGHKHLILGNHDSTWISTMAKRKARGVEGAREAEDFFDSMQDLAELKLDGNRLILCHYPMMSWNHMDIGSYLVFGHIHNSTHAPYWPLLWGMERALNAGVDINDFCPVTFDKLIENNLQFRRLHPPKTPSQQF